MAFGVQALRQKQPRQKEHMKTNKVIAGLLPCVSLLSAAWVLAASDVEDRLTKSFEAKPGGKLVVEADRGSIEVKSADADQVQIEVFRKVSRESQAKAEEILKNHEVRFSLEGNKVQVHAEFKKGFTGGWGDKGRNLQVRYQILAPKQFNVSLKTAGGSIKVADLIGEARGQTAGGRLRFGQMDGPLYGRTSGGSIKVTLAENVAVDVDAKTSGGRVVSEVPVTAVAPGEHKPNILRGKINGGGPVLSLETSGGSIYMQKK